MPVLRISKHFSARRAARKEKCNEAAALEREIAELKLQDATLEGLRAHDTTGKVGAMRKLWTEMLEDAKQIRHWLDIGLDLYINVSDFPTGAGAMA